MRRLLTALAATLAVMVPATALADFGIDGTACGYTTLQDAVDALPTGGTVYVGWHTMTDPTLVTTDITLVPADAGCVPAPDVTASISSTADDLILQVQGGAQVHLAGVDIHGGSDARPLMVGFDATLTITDATVDGGVDPAEGGCILAYGAGAVVVLGAGAVVEGCTAPVGGGVSVTQGARLEAQPGSVIRDNVATGLGGGGLWLTAGTAVLEGEISGNHAPSGGAIALWQELAGPWDPLVDITITADAAILDNVADESGAGIFVFEDLAYDEITTRVTLEGRALVAGNHAATVGGGVHAIGRDLAIVLREDARVADNIAVDDGGGIFVQRGALTVADDASLLGNVAGNDGGGVRAHLGARVVLRDQATLVGNVALGDGGGLMASDGAHLDIVDRVSIVDNQAVADGGGVALRDVAGAIAGGLVSSSTAVVFADNVAGGLGGGLAIDGAPMGFAIDGAVVTGNESSSGNGGGIGVRGADLIVGRVRAQDNRAVRGGGLAAEAGATIDIEGECDDACDDTDCTVFTGNVAAGVGLGGGLYARGGSSIVAARVSLHANVAVDGLAAYIEGAGTTLALRNTLVAGHRASAGAALVAAAGSLDVRHATLVDNSRAVRYAAGTTGPFHRNITAGNGAPNLLAAGLVGSCNVAPTAAQNPSGPGNATGIPSFAACWQPAAGSTLVVDACSSGASDDLLGRPRPAGAGFDRGAFERQ
ncbi:MAG: hypothetical protein U0168_04095 [Nannocystaceae bacterium]